MIDLNVSSALHELGMTDYDRAERVTGGADAAIWRIERGGRSFGLRILQPSQAGQMQREHAALNAAAAGGVPVPTVVASGNWQDRPTMLLDWCPGVSLEKALLANRFNPLAIRALGIEFGEKLAAIHRLHPPPELQDHSVSWQSWAGADPELQQCLANLELKATVLIHLDYHPLNVLVDGTKITAVLDWANARVGDPRADIARTLTIIKVAPLPSGSARLIVPALLRWFERSWRHGYERTAGPIGDLAPFFWWAGVGIERDLAPRLGRLDLPWLTPAYFERVQAWIRTWRERAIRRGEIRA